MKRGEQTKKCKVGLELTRPDKKNTTFYGNPK